MTIASPCVKICSIEPVSGLCIGCGRSRAEIAGWPRMSDGERADVLVALLDRPRPAPALAQPMDCAACGQCAGRLAA
jgi:predicted Fe-S protein YdhL (DUF1289 family)